MPERDGDGSRRRFDREHRARLEAEATAAQKTAELSAAVQELAAVNGALEASNAAVREFVAIAAHDLRGPLTSVIGFAELLLKRWPELDDSTRIEFLTTILEQGGRLDRLVNDLLVISRIEADAVDARPECLKLSLELARVIASFGDVPEIRVISDADPVVRVDRDHLLRILENYLSNAMKYGAPPFEVRIGECGRFGVVRVCDHGAGVPEDLQGKLYGKFVRGDCEVARRQGTGLGLAIVRGLARANGGDAWYEPQEPNGSRFAVSLPKG